MKVRHELTKKFGLISCMENFGGTKSIRNILRELKSNIDIFRGTIYLFNPKKLSKWNPKTNKPGHHKVLRVMRESLQLVGSLYLAKRNPSNETNTSYSSKNLTNLVYWSSHLYVVQYLLLHLIMKFKYT